MAEEEEKIVKEEKNEQSVTEALAGNDEGGSGGGLSKILRLALPVGILVLAASAGYFASQMSGGSGGAPAKASGDEVNDPPPPSDDEEYEYYDMEQIVTNLNVPRLERYIRIKLKLKIRSDDYKEASKVIEKKMPDLKNSLILYLADCSLDEISGGKNLNRILREIQDSFNERLWPNQRPLIAKVGYEEWAVQ